MSSASTWLSDPVRRAMHDEIRAADRHQRGLAGRGRGELLQQRGDQRPPARIAEQRHRLPVLGELRRLRRQRRLDVHHRHAQVVARLVRARRRPRRDQAGLTLVEVVADEQVAVAVEGAGRLQRDQRLHLGVRGVGRAGRGAGRQGDCEEQEAGSREVGSQHGRHRWTVAGHEQSLGGFPVLGEWEVGRLDCSNLRDIQRFWLFMPGLGSL
ncbi:hypothetical protein [Thioalkalivibrio sp. XN279]|uniref:hypothetical protein n=1 Tax=Thioalkalivibrio sp. XN279 TaxID=2714953 RepID=UPI00140C6B2F|nr:hypothetical protein [Thioalkalivibrio sp. XN279]NHA14129.1 hypothetical protein [Thioalkalivibrio sp. XN279]